MEHTVTWQLPITPHFPEIKGCVEFKEYKEQLKEINHQLISYSLEKKLIALSLEQLEAGLCEPLSRRRRARLYKNRSIALRCTIARRLLNSSFRHFHVELAMSWVLQLFVGILQTDSVSIPSKSQLERYEKWFSFEEMNQIMQMHVQKVLDEEIVSEPAVPENKVTLDRVYGDSTCIEANIHHPVDWVLLCDAGRSILRSIKTIRSHGLRHRMPSPRRLLRQLNSLSMAMSRARRQVGSKRTRKKILRKMKNLLKVIAQHGQRYVVLLKQQAQRASLSKGWQQLFMKRLENILDKVPQIIRQAHERIIGERKVANKDKVLSLYEDKIHVLVRGKSNAEVEFGNGLYLAEQEDGLIVDWDLFKDQPPADSNLVEVTIQRLKNYTNHKVKAYSADRGFDSRANTRFLDEEKIFNAICSRRSHERHARLGDQEYMSMQYRRSQTEGRIGIIRNVFLGGLIRSKGFEHRQLTLMWGLFCHNLWLVARLKRHIKKILLDHKKAA